MDLTAAEIELIRATYAEMKDYVDEASGAFYQRLFARSDAIREMFRGDIGDQGMRFMTALGVIVSSLDKPTALEDRLSSLGPGHKAIGVLSEHYAVLNAVLVETLASYAGDSWSKDAERAWQKALNHVADRMLDSALSD